MRRIIVETSFVSAILVTAYGIINIPNAVREIRAEAQAFVVELQQVRGEQLPQLTAKVALYKDTQRLSFTPKEMDCLAKNIYHEAGIEDRAGKIAVAQITYNRLKDGRWGNDICKVVYARAQFSWTLDKRKVNAKLAGELWEASRQAAVDFVNGKRVDRLGNSLHYHATYVNPKWASVDRQVHQVGQHIFYALK